MAWELAHWWSRLFSKPPKVTIDRHETVRQALVRLAHDKQYASHELWMSSGAVLARWFRDSVVTGFRCELPMYVWHMPGFEWTQSKRDFLKSLGFEPTPSRATMGKTFSLRDDGGIRQAVDDLWSAMTEVYGYGRAAWHLEFKDIEQRHLLLRRAMSSLAGMESMQARHHLYRTLLGHELLVPMHAEQEGWGIPSFCEVEKLQDAPVYVAFSDPAAFEAWGGDTQAVWVPGTALFPVLSRLKPGSLFLNRNSDVQGELYRNEIEAIAGAIPATRAGA